MRTKMKRFLSILLSLTMVSGLMPWTGLTVFAGTDVSYVDAKGQSMGSADCAPVAESMGTGWYVSDNVTFDKRIEVSGDVNLILKDGCTIKANDGIHIEPDSSLTIWAQSTGEGCGALEAKNNNRNSWKAAIGGNAETDKNGKYIDYTGSITINGGKILANGGPREFKEYGWGGAGICCESVTINSGNITAWGKGYGKDMISGAGIAGDEVTINGGTIEAKGRSGIGGNIYESCGSITINGGKINAEGIQGGTGIGGAYKGVMYNNIVITGGNVTAVCYDGAGIGTGEKGELAGKVEISGGDVTATGRTFSAGIGAGMDGSVSGDIVISGGKVKANGSAAGIGCGKWGQLDGTVTVSGGEVTATGGVGIGAPAYSTFAKKGKILIKKGIVTATGGYNSTGIGVGSSNSAFSAIFKGTVEISGGEVTATGGEDAAGIGSGYWTLFDKEGTIRITGGKVTATGSGSGAGIGAGYRNSFLGTVEIGGGEVTATGGEEGAGIGSGARSADSDVFKGIVKISGGTVTAKGGSEGGAGIGAGKNSNATNGHVHISGGTVIAKGGEGGAGIGGGNESWWYGGEGCDDVQITGGTVFAQSGEGNCSAIGHGDDVGHMGNITFANGLRVQTDSRTDGGIDGDYRNRKDDPDATIPFFTVSERDGACMYNHTALISKCEHPMDKGYNDGCTGITEKVHKRADCQYCGHVFNEEEHTFNDEDICTVCGYKNLICTVTFDANGGSGTMGAKKVAPGNKLTLPECGFTAPSGKAFAGWEIDGAIYAPDKSVSINENIKVKAFWSRAYPLWVGDIRVTEYNSGDILGDGKIAYDKLSHTLTLNSAWISSSSSYNGIYAGIIDGIGQLKIVVTGNSMVNVADADHGIYSFGALSVSGTGRLSVQGKDGIGTGKDLDISIAELNASGDNYGINANGNINISNSTVSVKGAEYGINALSNIVINGENSVVIATATGSTGQAMKAGGDIGFDNSTLGIVTPTNGTSSEGNILDKNSSTAKQVMISAPVGYDVWVGQTQVSSSNFADVLKDGSVSYDPDTHIMTFTTAPTINGTYANAMIRAEHDLTVVAPEGGLTLKNNSAAVGISTAGSLTLQGNVTINTTKRAILTGDDLTVVGDLTAKTDNSDADNNLIQTSGNINIDGNLTGNFGKGSGLVATHGGVKVTGNVNLVGSEDAVNLIRAGSDIDIGGDAYSFIKQGIATTYNGSANGFVANGDISVSGNVDLSAGETALRSENGSINVVGGKWELNKNSDGTVAMDAVFINIPDTHEVTGPDGGKVKTYTTEDLTRQTIYDENAVAKSVVIERKSDVTEEQPAAPTVQVDPTSVLLTYGAERTLTAVAAVDPETARGTLKYCWQIQEDGVWRNAADGINLTEYTIPADQAAGEYKYRCRVINTLNGESEQADSNEVTVTIVKAEPEITAPKQISLTYNGKPQRLAMSGSANGGIMLYSLDNQNWSSTVPTATNAGIYTLYYKVQGDENYNDLPGDQLSVSIAKRKLTITAEDKEKFCGEADPELTYLVEGLVSGDGLEGQLTRETGEEVGTYLISAEEIVPVDHCKDNYTLIRQGAVLKINGALGDVNSDGKVDNEDAALILKYSSGIDADINTSVADYNKDNTIDIRDAIAILNKPS